MILKPRSIRQKLTLWYVGLLIATLILLGGILYGSVHLSVFRRVDEALLLQARSFAEALHSFREAEKQREPASANWEAAPSHSLLALVERGQLPDLVKRWASKTGLLETERIFRILDRSGQPVAVSSGFTRFQLGLTEGEVRQAVQGLPVYETHRMGGQRIRAVIHPVTEQKRVLYLVQAAEPLGDEEASLRQLRSWLFLLIPLAGLLAATGGWFLASWAMSPIDRMIAQARGIGAAALGRRLEVPEDARELRRLAETFNELLSRVERAFRRLRQFSASASHELRTPLTAMRGEIEVALRRPRQAEEYRRTLQTNLETLQDISRIVETLLILARGEEADQVVDWHPVKLADLARQTSGRWEQSCQEKGVRLEVFAHDPLEVRGEERLLERLLGNLLENALRHTPPGGTVTVRADHWRDKASLTVQNTGAGIAPEEIPQIFDRFFRRSSPRPDGHSTGLGLGLCQWIAELHHGRIEVASPPGSGALFTVWLPLLSR